jgi:hypothetical protein
MAEPDLRKPTVLIEGQQDLFRAFKTADREARLFLRSEFRMVAEPVRRQAEELALTRIRNMRTSPKWARMRTGVTQRLVYVAPRQKGTRGRRAGRRPNLADLLMGRAMEPALDMNEPRIERAVERVFDEIADHFNRGGHL